MGGFMRKFIEKLIVLILCLYNMYKLNPSKDLELFLLLSLIISICLDLFSNKKIKYTIYLAFFILCFWNSLFIFYLPLILYNIYSDFRFYYLFILPLILGNFSLFNLLIAFISIYFANNNIRFNKLLRESKIVRDELQEDALYLKKYSDQLKVDKEKNVHIAILTERNRIAREVHDSIGHSISSSILQVQALKVVSKDNDTVESLNLLLQTLNNGMNDIRNSIHNLYNDSFDLKDRIEMICNSIEPIEVDLSYRIYDELDYNIKFDILSVIKETTTNCIKHSNATKIKITLLSQPKFYSIIVKDNGTNFDNTTPLINKGIGIASMEEMCNKYNGFLNYEFNNGFKIHLTLMKG